METGKRQKWLSTMLKIAEPVLLNLSNGKLKEKIPTQFHKDRDSYILLEAFGRTAQGIAPWLELEGLTGEERELQNRYRSIMQTCMDMATRKESADFMNFGEEGGQPLVDTAFLAHAIVRAPKQLYYNMEENVKINIVNSLKKSRKITPCVTNWLFFSAMVETALYVIGEEFDKVRIDYAVNMFETWYKGDGIYGDGEEFHWDYYNSFVIQPMYVDILRVFEKENEKYARLKPKVEKRAARYVSILERMIAPDGTYPIIGRSIVYRFGAFQMLAQAALEHSLPDDLPPSQVRCAITAVIEKTMEAKDMFDEQGWLLPGVYGNQPELAENYINIGSLYLCMAVFLPLGLLPQDKFWSDKEMDWTSKKVWSGQSIPIDHAI